MDQIGVVGLSYRHAGAEEIAGFTLPKDEIPQRLEALRATLGTAELVYLATCNRVEVAFAMPDGHPAHDLRAEVFRALKGRTPGPTEARSALRTWIGEAAVEHLFLMACGLDSAQAGEREIAAQLRGALETSRTAGVCGPVLDRIVGEALSLSGRLQRMAAEARPPSLADLAADRMQQHLSGYLTAGGPRPGQTRSPQSPGGSSPGGSESESRTDIAGADSESRTAVAGSESKSRTAVGGAETKAAASRAETKTIGGGSQTATSSGGGRAGTAAGPVAIVGVSPMTRRAAELLHKSGVPLLIVNRTLENAEELARSVQAEAMSLDAFRAQPRNVAGVIVATGGNGPVLDEPAVRRLAAAASRPPLIIDFGLPPNVDPAATQRAGLPRIGMNEMIQAAQDRRLAQLMRLAPMRAAIDERLTRLREQLASRAIGPQLAELRNSFERIAAAEADRALAEELHDLDPHQQEQVRHVIQTLAHRLAHLPLAGMRAAAPFASSEAVEAFFREARLQRASRNVPPPVSSRVVPGATSADRPHSSPARSEAPRAEREPAMTELSRAHTSLHTEKRSR